MEAATVRGSRYPAVDALRGFALVHMVCYHAVWDLVNLHGLELSWYDGWPGFLWQQFICWSFILLAGVCQPFSRRPVRHGVMLLAAGALDWPVYPELRRAFTAAMQPEQSLLLGEERNLLKFTEQTCSASWG